MDLVRQVLFAVETRNAEEVRHAPLPIVGYDDPTVARRVAIMQEQGPGRTRRTCRRPAGVTG